MNKHTWRDVVLAADLPPGVKVVAFAIASAANDKTLKAYYRYAKIGGLCRMAERTVRTAVSALADAGFLTVAKRRFGGPNELTLTVFQSGSAKPHSNQAQPSRSIRPNQAAQSGLVEPLHIDSLSPFPFTLPSEGPSEERMDTTEFIARPTGISEEERRQALSVKIKHAVCRLYGLTPENAFRVDGRYVDAWAFSHIEVHRQWPEIESLAFAGKLPTARLAALLEETGVAAKIRERLKAAA